MGGNGKKEKKKPQVLIVENDDDLVVEAPKKKRVKPGAVNPAPQNIMNEDEGRIEGLEGIRYDPFHPVQTPRTGYSGLSQANNALWRGVGNTVCLRASKLLTG